MPTIDELRGLYKKGTGDRNITPLLEMTGWYVWSRETKGSTYAWVFYSGNGTRYSMNRFTTDTRAFAVRSRGDG